MFSKKGALKNFSTFAGKHLFWSFFLINLKLYLKKSPTLVFSCEIFKNTYFEDLRTTANLTSFFQVFLLLLLFYFAIAGQHGVKVGPELRDLGPRDPRTPLKV